MKKILFFLLLASLISCKKDYACVCKALYEAKYNSQGLEPVVLYSYVNDTVFNFTEKKKKSTFECKKNENEHISRPNKIYYNNYVILIDTEVGYSKIKIYDCEIN